VLLANSETREADPKVSTRRRGSDHPIVAKAIVSNRLA
jgi:hypothetical protein